MVSVLSVEELDRKCSGEGAGCMMQFQFFKDIPDFHMKT